MSRAVLRLSKTTVASEVDWSELIGRLLPDELPRRQEPCTAVLKSIFQRDLPDGVLQAASSLVTLELESEARALLIDCSGQLIPDTVLSFSSATTGAIPPLKAWGRS